MHDVKVQIRCQRCGNQMDLKDPGPNDDWPPTQFWECPECGRHFWTTYPPPKKPAPSKAAEPTNSDKATEASTATVSDTKSTPES